MTILKIGSRTYSIIFSDDDEILNSSENQNAFGYTDYANSKIVIKNSISNDFKKENLIHEILHTLLDNSGIEIILENSNKITTELIISVLAPRFHQFLKDNPDVIKTFSD